MNQKKFIQEFIPSSSSQGSEFEESYLDSLGVHTLNTIHVPTSESTVGPTVVTTRPDIMAVPIKRKHMDKSEANAQEIKLPEDASDILLPYIGTHLTLSLRRSPSSYLPSSLMMDYLLHHVNLSLVDNFYFTRFCPDYHPYVMRLYFGILFWIQCLRACQAVSAISNDDELFLNRFLAAHPPSTLPVLGPLIPVFTTLSSSRPEIETYGSVHPRLPPLPYFRSDFFDDTPEWHLVPNVPGIFALIEHLDFICNAENPVYPDKGMHIPVPADAEDDTPFGHYLFPVLDERTPEESWALVSSGLQYPCEADERLNQAFAERIGSFNFPRHQGDDAINFISGFLSMNGHLSWFNQIKSVAASAAAFFEGSGTLATCEPSVCCANQFVVSLQRPAVLPAQPLHSADERSLFPFSFKLTTTCRNPPPLSEALASMSQTHVTMFEDHPRFGQFNAHSFQGEFWNIRPIESSRVDHSTYLALPEAIKGMMKDQI